MAKYQMTDEQIAEEMKDHAEMVEGMDKQLEEMAQGLGRNHPVIQKMMKIQEIFRSFTRQEIIDLVSLEYEQDESASVQETL